MNKKFCDVCEKAIDGIYVVNKQNLTLMGGNHHQIGATILTLDLCIPCSKEAGVDKLLDIKTEEFNASQGK